jgi:uncharacterized protein (TIGR03435 family)
MKGHYMAWLFQTATKMALIEFGLIATIILDCHGQTQPAAGLAQKFEVLSLKHIGNVRLGPPTVVGGIGHIPMRQERPLTYTGVRLSGEVRLISMIYYAYSPLLSPYYRESPDWMDDEFYQVEAIAPPATTNDAARAMLRVGMVERLGLKWKIIEREMRVLMLLRTSMEPKLVPATEVDSDKTQNKRGAFLRKSATIGELAQFLSFFADARVIDKTGIGGTFRFDEDWSSSSNTMRGDNPSVAFALAKKLGLRLEATKELQKVLVIERANLEPTPN